MPYPGWIVPVILNESDWWNSGATLALDFTNNRYQAGGVRYGAFTGIPNASVTNSNGTVVNAAGNIEAVADNTPRLDYSTGTRGLLIEDSRTNYFLNSLTPVTQTIDLTTPGTGNYTLTHTGPGSTQVTANTGAATGLGTATDGTPVTFNVTSAGTFDFTVTGSPDAVQVEKGAFGTSHIITAGTSVTRTADVVKITGMDTSGVTDTDGTLYTKFSVFINKNGTSTASQTVAALANAGFTNRAEIIYQESSNTRLKILSEGTETVSTSSPAPAVNQTHKIAAAWQTNDAAITINGSVTNTDSTVTEPTSLPELRLGVSFGYLNGHIYYLEYFPTRKPNAELQALTV